MNDKEEFLKIRRLYDMMYVLFHMKIMGQSMKRYFEKRNYQSVAVYGMGNLGEIVIEEFRDEGINVQYAIDRRADDICYEIDIYKPNDDLKKVDVVVVTPFVHFEEIRRVLEEKMDCPIISIEDLVKEVICKHNGLINRDNFSDRF